MVENSFEYLKELIVPSNFCFALAAIGCALWFIPRTRRVSASLIGVAVGTLLILSSGKTAAWLLGPLEYAYPYVSNHAAPSVDPPTAIVVLAGYADDDPLMPLSSRANSSALHRIVEAIHLRNRCTDCRVIVTGFDPTVRIMGETLLSLGLPKEQLVLDSQAANTAASAANLKTPLQGQSFYLVTSAGHMRRSIGVFAKQGLKPVPAPTDHLLPKSIARAKWRPSPYHLMCSDLAIREYVGMAWYWMGGKI